MQSHWYSSPFWLCLSLSVIVSVAPCNGQLVGPGAVTTFSGGGGRSRGGFATIRDPAAGFFVAGSSIKGMNGVYRRIAEEGVDERREVTLAYKNKFTGWILAMIEPPEDSPYEVVGSKRSEWLLLDAEYNDRFGHEGRTLVPGSGTRWSHLHRAPPFGKIRTTTGEESASDVVIALPEEKKERADDMEELPWQLIYIGDPSMVSRLESQYAAYMYVIRQALDYNKVYESGDFKTIRAPSEHRKSEILKETGHEPPEDLDIGLWHEGMLESCLGFYSAQLKEEEKPWRRAVHSVAKSACHRRNRDLKEEVLLLTQVLEDFPHYTRARELRGVSFLDLGDPQSALEDFEQILTLKRDYQNLEALLVRASADLNRKIENTRERHDNTPLIGASSADDVSQRVPEKLYNHYLWLQLPFDFNQSELKKAYRKLSKLYHPDMERGSSFAFEKLAAAYTVLSDVKSRKAYDEGSDLDLVDEKATFKEKVMRKYFPDSFGFEPFGDPLEKRKQQERHERARNRPKPKPNAPNIPEGTYRKSCKGCHLVNNDTTLMCTHCLGLRAAAHSSSLDLETCAADEIIGNVNGQLICEEVKGDPLPVGTYAETCKKCHFVRDGVLECRCHTGQRYQRTSLAVQTCGPEVVVANQYGTLVCAKPLDKSEEAEHDTTVNAQAKAEL